MDDSTTALILDILHQDALDTTERQKGKQKAGHLSDSEIALHIWQEELESCVKVLDDYRLARSIANAVQDDEVELTRVCQEEACASDDRRIALRLAGRPVPPQEPPRQPDALNLPDDALKTITDSFVPKPQTSIFQPFVNPFTRAESSKDAESRSSTTPEAVHYCECVACTEFTQPADIIEASCSHKYCRICVTRLFQDAMTDESLFPPRCCRIQIPLSLAREYLGVSLSQKFEEKSIEFTDPHRTYCSNSTCSKYIFPHLVQLYVGTCNQCFQRTCTLCKKAAHEGKCPDEDEEVIQLGQREGWQRCFQCRNMIELGTGCNHITCRCGAEFCYVCGTKWRHCRCELWDENRLYNRARDLANRARGPGQAAPARPEEVRRMVRWLRERHECAHEEYWPRIEGPHQCEECRDQLPTFILQCGHCGLRACVRCRLNRL